MLINNELFLIKDSEIPKIPIEFSEESRLWWQEQRKRCIEGYTVGGKWMSPNLYFYINFWKILLNKGKSKTKTIARPLLRDIEWEVFTAWSLARGLSEFKQGLNLYNELTKSIINPTTEDRMKLLMYPGRDFGCPVYNNDAKDLMLMGPREFGKSYLASGGIIAHEWIFNGEKEYIPPQNRINNSTSNIVVGAGDSTYSKDLLTKFKIGYDEIAKGGLDFNNRYYPHPFAQSYEGSLASGKHIIAQSPQKIGGSWRTIGSKSMIKHVSYKNNEYAAQGTRNSVMVKEEIGMFEHLEKAREADKETMMSGTSKFGSCLYIGTGGAMEGGTLGAYKMYYDPSTFDLLEFTDRWENKGKIGMFISAVKRPNEFKDEQGNTNEELATIHFENERERIKKGKNSNNALRNYIMYNPLKPSEIFLRSGSNRFPVAELQEVLAELETNKEYLNAEYIGELVFDTDNNLQWRLNPKINPIRSFPLRDSEDKTGGIVIYEQPYTDPTTGEIPNNIYIAGIDPYDNDESTTNSLGSTLVYNRLTQRIVAEYTARPETADKYYENCRRLLMYYNAKALYENNKRGIFVYFRNHNSTSLLAKTPKLLKDVIKDSRITHPYGINASIETKRWGDELTKIYLLSKSSDDPDALNLHKLKSPALVNELIMYNEEDNFDRVDAFKWLMWYNEDLRRYPVDLPNQEDNSYPDFFNRPLFQRHNERVNSNNFSYRLFNNY